MDALRKSHADRQPTPIINPPAFSHDTSSPTRASPEPLTGPVFDTEPNTFGVFRRYTVRPHRDPEDEITLDALCDSPAFSVAPSADSHTAPLRGFGNAITLGNFFSPFLNVTTFRFMHWFYGTSSLKSAADLNHLVNDVILAEDFDHEHLRDFSATRECKHIDNHDGGKKGNFSADDGWCEGSVKIHLPKENKVYADESAAPEFEVEGLYYRKLLEVIKAAYRDPIARKFHWITPFSHVT
ncbi:hypothetical protein BKA93DRAFT_742984 [Sparassis latifolia]